MTLLLLKRMCDRVDLARSDSDTTFFYDLLLLGEMTTKLVAAAIISAIDDDPNRHRYRQLYQLVRADGLGDWAAAIDEALSGPASQELIAGARDHQKQLSQRFPSGSWQHDACTKLAQCLDELGVLNEKLPGKVSARRWFSDFVLLRNKTRGHGAQLTAKWNKICPLLDESIRCVLNNCSLFKAEWAYLHRNLSGKYRVTALTNSCGAFGGLKSTRTTSLTDGVYIDLGVPRRVELVASDIDAQDFFFPNGGFTGTKFELVSYLTGNRCDTGTRNHLWRR